MTIKLTGFDQFGSNLKGKFNVIVDESSSAIVNELPIIMQEIVDEGVANQKEFITTAVTQTGEKRASDPQHRSSKRDAGLGIAGRVESDDMRQSVGGDVTAEPGVVTGKWGWIENFLKYFGVQDDGYGAIPAANSLLKSFVLGREKLTARLTSIARDSQK